MALQERIDRLDMVVKGLDAILLAVHDEPDVVYCRKELTTFKNFFAQRLTSLQTTKTFVEKHELSKKQESPEVGYSNSPISNPKCKWAKTLPETIPNCPKCGKVLQYDPDLLGPGVINAPHWDCDCGYTRSVEPEDYGIDTDKEYEEYLKKLQEEIK